MSATQLMFATIPKRSDQLDRKAKDFDKAHPEVYAALVVLAREEKTAGVERGSINALFEVLRRNHRIATGSSDPMLNNSHRAYYARKIMDNCTDLAGFFETRERISEHHAARADA